MNLHSWNRFLVDALYVVPEIIGQLHKFDFEGANVEIRLPSADRATDETPGRDKVASVGTRLAIDNTPIDYQIQKVDVHVHLGCSIDLPEQVLQVNANAFALVPNEKQMALESLLNEHGVIAGRAFAYWVSVLQWVTGDHRIGRGGYTSNASGWSTRLLEEQSAKTVWIQGVVFSVPSQHTITAEQWSVVTERIQSAAAPPIYMMLKLEAEHFLDLGDFRRSLMDTAIACETYLRTAVLGTLPDGLAPSITDQVDKLNIAQYVNHLFPEFLGDVAALEYKKLRPELNSLFAKRNDLFHKGDSSAATAENCRRFLDKLNELFSLVL